MSTAHISFNRPALVGRELEYIREAIERGQLSGDGYFTRLCNSKVEALTGASKALLTHSCTAALEIAAILCDVGPGDEVIMPSFTFVSTANAVVLRGGIPVFVDIDPETLNLDPAEVAKAITKRTRAIFAVHYAGFPADMDALSTIAKDNNIMLVEDAAQALGSTYKGRPAGSLGDIAAFSFHETKNVIAGEGGALTLNRSELFERAEIVREKGTNRSKFFRGQVDKYTWVDIGSSFLPGELIAAYLCAQLELAETINARRILAFQRYWEALKPLADMQKFELPRHPPHCTGNGHMFYLLLPSLFERSRYIDHMARNGITCPFHYVPLHSSPAGRRLGRTPGRMTHTDLISETLVRLPMHLDIGPQQDAVVATTFGFFE
jgi:dTDP-4-amino-4,6-dideoxygalactose transaminase